MNRLVTTAGIAVLMFGALPGARAVDDVKVRELRWTDAANARQAEAGGATVERGADGKATGNIVVVNAKDEPRTFTILTIEKPGIATDKYIVKGTVDYEDVAGSGYMEMWNHFGAAAYFSRTLGGTGPMGVMSGSAKGRFFMLPFTVDEGSGKRPDKLVLNVVLAGRGSVTVHGMTLTEFPGAAAVVTVREAFWPGRAMTWLAGGIGGAAVLAAVIAWQRRARAAAELRRMRAMDV